LDGPRSSRPGFAGRLLTVDKAVAVMIRFSTRQW
jgi:hypothetical protein